MAHKFGIYFGTDGANGSVNGSDSEAVWPVWAEAGFQTMIYTGPVLFIFGVSGNVLSLLVLRRPGFRGTSFAFLLQVLCVVDTLNLLVSLTNVWIRAATHEALDWRDLSPTLCKLGTFVTYFLYHLSCWVICVLNVSRAISVALPFKASSWCSTKATAVALVMISIVLAIFNAPRIPLKVLQPCKVKDEFHCQPALNAHPTLVHLLDYGHIILGSLLPFAIIITCNAIIYTNMRMDAIIVSNGDSTAQRDKRALAITLIALSATFLLTTSPYCAFSVCMQVTSCQKAVHHGFLFLFLYYVANLLSFTNNALNIIFYACAGGTFRRELKNFLKSSTKCCRKVEQQDYSLVATQYSQVKQGQENQH